MSNAVANNSMRKWKHEENILFVEGYSDLLFYAEMLEDLGFNTSHKGNVSIPKPGEWIKSTDNETHFGIFIVGTGKEKPEVESLAWEA